MAARSSRYQRIAAAVILAALAGLALACVAIARDPIAVLRLAHHALLRIEGVDEISSDGVVLQQTLYDCGPAALANLLLVAGRANPGTDTLAVLAGTSPRGTTLTGLRASAQAFDLPLQRVERGQTAGELPRAPFIAWVDRNHFVVVASRPAAGRLVIIDPRVGRFITDEHEFAGHWSGEALVVTSSATGTGS